MKSITIHISISTIIQLLIAISLFALLWYLRDIVLIFLLSIVIGSAIIPAARALEKYKIPKTIAVTIVYALFFASFFAITYFFAPPILQETSSALSMIPDSTKAESYSKNLPSFLQSFSLSTIVTELNKIVFNITSDAFSVVNLIFGGVLNFVLIVIFSFYFAVNEKSIEGFLRVITPKENEKYIINLWRRSQKKMGRWLQGQLLLGVLVGVLVYLGLAIMGIQYALVLAVLAGLLELIPIFGPILSMIPAIAIAFVSGGITLALYVFIFYLLVQQFENALIYPLVVTKVVGVPPLLVILALIIGAKLAGMIGILLSIPVAAVLQELFADMDKYRQKRKAKI